MNNKNKYNILISADCLTTYEDKELNFKLVASLYDIETKEKISDGETEDFEILDYNFIKVTNQNESIDKFILSEIKESLLKIIKNNGYNESYFHENLFKKNILKKSFKVTEYEIARIYTLAEVYYELMGHSNKYSNIIELISEYDFVNS